VDVFIKVTNIERRSHGDFVEDSERLSTEHRVSTIRGKSKSHL